jgi:hypothetical protein
MSGPKHISPRDADQDFSKFTRVGMQSVNVKVEDLPYHLRRLHVETIKRG